MYQKIRWLVAIIFGVIVTSGVASADMRSYEAFLNALERDYVVRFDYTKSIEAYKNRLMTNDPNVFAETLANYAKDVLNDTHFQVFRSDGNQLRTLKDDPILNFDMNKIHRFLNGMTIGNKHGHIILGRILYIYIENFYNINIKEVTDILDSKKNLFDKVIFDIRMNRGGDDLKVFEIMSYFVKNKIVHGYSVARVNGVNGLYETQFNPIPGKFMDGKIVSVLTGQVTGSAAETFTSISKFMKFKTYGDRTAGAGTGYTKTDLVKLPNGVSVGIPDVDTLYLDKTRLEHNGFKPDFPVVFDQKLPYDNIIVKAFSDFGYNFEKASLDITPDKPNRSKKKKGGGGCDATGCSGIVGGLVIPYFFLFYKKKEEN